MKPPSLKDSTNYNTKMLTNLTLPADLRKLEVANALEKFEFTQD
jgi:hypothetical protein